MAKISFHCQRVPGWVGPVLRDLGAGWVKIVNPSPGGDPFPDLKKVLRFHTDKWDRPLIARGAAGADDYMVRMLPAWRQFQGWAGAVFELPNEPDVNSNDGIGALNAFTQRCRAVAHGEGFRVGAGCWPEGNPHDNGTGNESVVIWKTRQLAHGLVGADYWCLHAYWCPPVAGPGDRWHATKYRDLAAYVRQEGIEPPPILITEAGIDGSIAKRPYKSWRTLSSRQAYAADIVQYERETRQDDPVQAFFLFTAGYEEPWEDFDIDEPLARSLVAPIKALPVPVPPPKPTGGHMEIDGRQMTTRQFIDYMAMVNMGPVETVVIHHTWKPTPETWHGTPTMLGMKAYYEGLGWDAGPHVFCAPDGIWLFTPLTQDGIGVTGHNYRTRHVELVGDCSDRLPDETILTEGIAAAAAILKRAGRGVDRLKMHCELEPAATCPGAKLASVWKAFKAKVGWAISPPQSLPEYETATDPATLAEKARWWLEECQRTYEAGDTDRAEEIRLSLIKLLYRLETALKPRG